MNNLQKLSELLAKDGRTVVCGVPRSMTAENTVVLGIGDGDDARRSLGDKPGVRYTTVNVDVYAADYSAGYDLLLELRREIESAVKSTVAIVFKRFRTSEYNEQLQRNVLRSQYKIIE